MSELHLYMDLTLTGFYPSPKSFWSCTHVNSCPNYTLYIYLHILLIILLKTSLKIQESTKSYIYINRYIQNNFYYVGKLVLYL